ncbi:Cupin 2, conserved barrel domain protein [Desulforamulus reducens MI-1]|uniref:Cupin 2, conserved barrel domain protein n=1 Tax=Desulforamulus reducens (strain ATCC BAA-1160 / DSM 100696 / MI-1) TaxID=349161 RepID=A4J4T6_DESRM|nr:cupin domain-containing protein [Desulforamulus reducens]ABO50089.1 Cupin 2, conserved barrel domain protein [Desulforamulus reducens MI-1]
MQVIAITDIVADKNPAIVMKTIFSDKNITMGTVVIPPGARIPKQGIGVHEGDEYSLILKGSIKTMSGGKEYQVQGGQATFIPAGEEHWCCNDDTEECEIVWFLTK